MKHRSLLQVVLLTVGTTALAVGAVWGLTGWAGAPHGVGEIICLLNVPWSVGMYFWRRAMGG